MDIPTTLTFTCVLRALTFTAIMALNASVSYSQQTEDEQAMAQRVDDILVALGAQDGRHLAVIERQDEFTRFTRPSLGGFWMIRARRP